MTRRKLTPDMAADMYARDKLETFRANGFDINPGRIEYVGATRVIAEAVCRAALVLGQPDAESYEAMSDRTRKDEVHNLVAFAAGSLLVLHLTESSEEVMRNDIRDAAEMVHAGILGDIVSLEEYIGIERPIT